MTTEQAVLEPPRTQHGENEVHIACMDDVTRALCGVDLRGAILHNDARPSTCVVCEQLNTLFPLEQDA